MRNDEGFFYLGKPRKLMQVQQHSDAVRMVVWCCMKAGSMLNDFSLHQGVFVFWPWAKVVLTMGNLHSDAGQNANGPKYKSQHNGAKTPLFCGYRDFPWLNRGKPRCWVKISLHLCIVKRKELPQHKRQNTITHKTQYQNTHNNKDTNTNTITTAKYEYDGP